MNISDLQISYSIETDNGIVECNSMHEVYEAMLKASKEEVKNPYNNYLDANIFIRDETGNEIANKKVLFFGNIFSDTFEKVQNGLDKDVNSFVWDNLVDFEIISEEFASNIKQGRVPRYIKEKQKLTTTQKKTLDKLNRNPTKQKGKDR